MRERGQSQRHVVKDMLLLRQLRNYGHATSFNFSSGSVVDMAFKSSTLKLAVANVATQDIYNRNGNLLLCDLNKSVTKTLWGHERPGQVENQTLTVTVNDIKLSYSKNFFLSGADDHRVMVKCLGCRNRKPAQCHSGCAVSCEPCCHHGGLPIWRRHFRIMFFRRSHPHLFVE
ncbi:hypothetical protein BCR41DRAFT_30328 [Lobosporangium transversale]|uniref:Uncharacterized protein n=1 Tax=Lobosporangium transversale TaxID=64571 RepID=A0A1Y2GSE3_9FUNG|nr:hypothetical protein BCR41DRAFT_30328 [Lobosporangium transversale]ORZ21036.1 hypothetical protein BCR41DRAFT_30328 [Lobosporangium transversale]|eukprot:XP_021882945.1 hypothetical protein BCR41DRAFT_30328 [Lobosporangium transversale]